MHAVLFAVVLAAADPTKESAPLSPSRSSRTAAPSTGSTDPYDPKDRRYHLLVRDIARFKVKSAADDLAKRPVVLEVAGMLDKPEGPLTLDSAGKTYVLSPEGHDRQRFRVTRKNGVTTIEFLPRGKKLLRPGATFQYIDFYRT